MKKIYTIISLLAISSFSQAQTFQTFHDFSALTILEDTLDLATYAGKKVLVVNTASFCGYTPQFEALQELDSVYSIYNFEVIGFPCNDFGNQDPHGDSTILDFCTGTYGVTFQMMSKVHTVSGDTAPVFKWLQRANLNGVSNAPVGWNFNKYLIDENGQWVRHFPSTTSPLDTEITNWITAGGSSSGVGSHSLNSNFKLVNNPVKDIIELESDIQLNELLTISLLDLQGRIVMTSITAEKGNISLSVADIPLGLYYVSVSGKSINTTLKVVIEN